MIRIYNEDATNAKNLFDLSSVDLGIFDPPFGIDETLFNRHYKREDNVIKGYIEAPTDYLSFTKTWLSNIIPLMKKNSSIYIISGWSNLEYVLRAAREANLLLCNHIIWKYNFGVFTKKKFVSSHYHILYYRLGNPVFNTYAKFTQFDKNVEGKSSLYNDLEDVWIINKDFAPKQCKNINKLPDDLIRKIILYSSNSGDTVLDTFLGNFTTATNALLLGRHAHGLELNKNAFDIGMDKLKTVEFGSLLPSLPIHEKTAPKNQGRPISDEEFINIRNTVREAIQNGMTKKQAIYNAMERYERGYFSILNIVNVYKGGITHENMD